MCGAGRLRAGPSPLLALDLQPDDPYPAHELVHHGDLGLVRVLVPLADQVVVARVQALLSLGDGGCCHIAMSRFGLSESTGKSTHFGRL